MMTRLVFASQFLTGPGREGDAVHLVGQQIAGKKRSAKRMGCRVFADLPGDVAKPFPHERVVDVLLRVRVEKDLVPHRLQAPDPRQKVCEVGDRPSFDGPDMSLGKIGGDCP